MKSANNWKDYELLDTSDGMRLERWGKYTLVRPDPQVIWKNAANHPAWKTADAKYNRSGGGGSWDIKALPAEWKITYRDLTFKIKPMGFKHTGLFPEQAVNWDWFSDLIRKEKAQGRDVKVLNLFAYTGGATIAAAKAGVTGRAVDGAARAVIDAAGYGAYFGHSFGHGVGVEIHEAPNASPMNEKPLPAGAIISAEPGIYLPGSLGVRIEDVILLTEDGCHNLTLAPKTLLVL